MKNVLLRDGEIWFSFDVYSPFSIAPISETLEYLARFYFQNEGNFHEQQKESAMGNHSGFFLEIHS